MREIKFRAFDDGKMLYSHNNITNSSKFQNKWFFEKIREDAIVMQYTGLKDKEGREIYEGDIIAHPEFYETPEMSHNPKKYVVVKFKDCAFRIYDVILSDEEKDNNDYFYVAGNIYENPELLTK